jgi:hypothetical protein
MATPESRKAAVRIAVSVAIALVVAVGVRYAIIEPVGLAHLCGAPGAPWWCAPRALAAAALDAGALGFGSLAAGVLAIFTRLSGWALAGACLGAAGLVLYAAATGAVGLLLGLLVLARTAVAGMAPPDARRERDA